MDLKNLETTSTYAIEAVYRYYYDFIPEKYRLKERNQLVETKDQSRTVLTYEEVETVQPEQEYVDYIKSLQDSELFFNFYPFYDPELNFDNRMHYKIVGVNYPTRNTPWFVITWNCGDGVLKSEISNRRFTTTTIETPSGEKVKCNVINGNMDLILCIYCNTMQGLFELQENILVGQREKCTVETRKHSILGNFTVALNSINSRITKLPRDKGTIGSLTLDLKIDYPVIGKIIAASSGIIKEIHTEIDAAWAPEQGPGHHEVLARDIVTDDSD